MSPDDIEDEDIDAEQFCEECEGPLDEYECCPYCDCDYEDDDDFEDEDDE